MLDKEKKGTLYVIIAALFVGTFPVVSKFGLGRIDPFFLGAAFNTVAAVFVLLVLAYRGGLHDALSVEHAPWMIAVAFTSTVYTTTTFLLGARATSGINSALLLEVEPLYATVVGYILLKERVGRKQLYATALTLTGAFLVLFNGTLAVETGDLLIAATPLGFVASNYIVKTKMQDIDSYTISGGRLFYAAIMLIAITLVFGNNDLSVLSDTSSLAAILFLGIVPTSLGILIWYAGLRRINMSKATAMMTLYPVVSVVLAWPILGELPNVFQLGGLVLMLMGLYFLSGLKSLQRV